MKFQDAQKKQLTHNGLFTRIQSSTNSSLYSSFA